MLLEQVKTFCSKHNIDYELFDGDNGMAGMHALPPGGGEAPGRIVEARKELSADDLKPPAPPAPVVFGGGLFGHAGHAGFGGLGVGGFGAFGGFGVPAPAPAFVFHPPAPVRPPPKRS